MKVTITKAGAVVTLEPNDTLGHPHIVWCGPAITFVPVPVIGDREAIAYLTKACITGNAFPSVIPPTDDTVGGGSELCKDAEDKSSQPPSVPACDVCGKPSCGVCASPLGPISHAICSECVQVHRVPWGELVAGLYGVPRDAVADWVEPYLKATCAFYKKTEDTLWEEIEKFSKDYEAHCREGFE